MMAENPVPSSALTTAATGLNDFATTTLNSAAGNITKSLDSSFAALARTIARTTDSGKSAVRAMVESIVSDLDRISTKSTGLSPLNSIVSYAADSLLPLSGARDAGGAVNAGSAYLVGESGPELFVPSQSGAVGGASSTQMHFHVQATDAASFLRSESQISAMMLRALARGRRNL